LRDYGVLAVVRGRPTRVRRGGALHAVPFMATAVALAMVVLGLVGLVGLVARASRAVLSSPTAVQFGDLSS
jgi:hypothetical protein